jgi:2-polyprenyl-3-methyl-5-hydroxy-6-metoxy-1,4-benzoquinol methylase
MLPFVPTTAKRILEIGCGEGNFGIRLKKSLSAEVWGIEYEKIRADVAKTKLDHVLCGDVCQLIEQLPNQYFDTVICNDVLEHLTDPYAVLKNLQIKLQKNAVVVSSIPNVRYFRNFFDLIFSRNWDYTEQGVMDFTHFRFFTEKSICKMYESLGFKVIKQSGINASKSLKPWPLIVLTLGAFSDIRFTQFATVARWEDRQHQ